MSLVQASGNARSSRLVKSGELATSYATFGQEGISSGSEVTSPLCKNAAMLAVLDAMQSPKPSPISTSTAAKVDARSSFVRRSSFQQSSLCRHATSKVC